MKWTQSDIDEHMKAFGLDAVAMAGLSPCRHCHENPVLNLGEIQQLQNSPNRVGVSIGCSCSRARASRETASQACDAVRQAWAAMNAVFLAKGSGGDVIEIDIDAPIFP